MFKKFFSIIWILISGLFKVIFKILFFILKIIWWIVRFVWYIFFPKLPKEEVPVDMIFNEDSAVKKVGSIIPVEEDHNLRLFTLTNAEGEIYHIDTSVKGPFYGPVWTQILSCYECHRTLRGRLIKQVHGKTGRPAGYRVKIGKIRTFLPNYHSMRFDNPKPINVRIGILSIDFDNKRVTTSIRLAYEIIFNELPTPQVEESCKALYWNYDESYIYFLLPGKILGKTPNNNEQFALGAKMGEITTCIVNSISPVNHEATVSLCEDLEHEENTDFNEESSLQNIPFKDTGNQIDSQDNTSLAS